MNCYKANAVSRNDIRRCVRELKKLVGMENVLYFPIVKFLENVLPVLIPDFQLEIVPKDEMRDKHGETFPDKCLIRIREDIYYGAIGGNGRDRLTLAHEIGHLLLHEGNGIALCRMQPGERLKSYEDPEWQADAFGGELLASSYLIKGMSESEVMRKCGVSSSAARVQLRTLNR